MNVSVKKLYLTGKGIEKVIRYMFNVGGVFFACVSFSALIKDYFARIILTSGLTITVSNSVIITLAKFGPEGEPTQHHFVDSTLH